MRDVVVDFASRPTKREVLAALDEALARSDGPGVDREAVVAGLRADRQRWAVTSSTPRRS